MCILGVYKELVITEANVQIVEETVAYSPKKSVWKTAAAYHLGKTVHTIMWKCPTFFPCKIQSLQLLQTHP